MGISIKHNVSFKRIAERIKKQNIEALSISLEKVVTDIKAKTNSGQDINGGALKAYSKGYAARREQKGRSRTPNMRWTGAMMQSLSQEVKAGPQGLIGRIFFNATGYGSGGKTTPQVAKYNLAIRKFFGLSRANRGMILNNLKKK